MIGSSNFSKPTYLVSDSRTNQTDIAFFKASRENRTILQDILNSAEVNVRLLEYWKKEVNSYYETEFLTTEISNEWRNRTFQKDIPTFPYENREDILNNFLLDQIHECREYSLINFDERYFRDMDDFNIYDFLD